MPQSPIPFALSLLTFLPLVGAIVLMFMPKPKDLPDPHHGHDDAATSDSSSAASADDPARTLVNGTAFIFAAITFGLSLLVFANFDSNYVNLATRNMQFIETIPWITMGGMHIQYHLGVDGISLLLIVLTTFLMLLSVLFSTTMKTRLKEFMVFLLLLETGMIGVFCAMDLVLFYVFWEAMLIPMYFLIGIFGHENRIYAAIKFFLYTFAGSIFMLIAIVAVYQITGTFDIIALSSMNNPAHETLTRFNPQMLMWMFAAFSLAFAIKVPMFPFHTWLPDAHVEAPTAGSVILAGVMLKMGTYGLIRLCLPLFPEQAQQAAPIFITLAIIGIIYGSIVAAIQPDAKKLVAYSSVAHLGFVVLGIFTFTPIGMMGAMIQNINHGISTPMLFFLVGMLYERRHTRLISEYGGLKKIVPFLATMLLLATFSSIAVPFFNGFVGEFPILVGSWVSLRSGPVVTGLAATGMILSAVYMLWWFQRLMLGPITKEQNKLLPDLSRIEWLVLSPLVVVIFWIGLGSNFWTSRMNTAVSTLISLRNDATDVNMPVAARLTMSRSLDLRKEFDSMGNTRSGSLHTPRSGAPGLPPGPSGVPGSNSNKPVSGMTDPTNPEGTIHLETAPAGVNPSHTPGGRPGALSPQEPNNKPAPAAGGTDRPAPAVPAHRVTP